MDCRRFQKQHPAFVDDNLSQVAMVAMRIHLAACARCANHDALLRRALIVVRSSPPLAPTAQFRRRLAVRLAAERAGPPVAPTAAPWRRRLATASALLVLAATGGVIATVAALRYGPPPALTAAPEAPAMRTPVPLAFSTPRGAESPASPAMFATVSAGFPVYPAVILARRAAQEFAATHGRAIALPAIQ